MRRRLLHLWAALGQFVLWLRYQVICYWGFSRAEANGTIILLVLMISLFFVTWGYYNAVSAWGGPSAEEKALLEATFKQLQERKMQAPAAKKPARPATPCEVLSSKTHGGKIQKRPQPSLDLNLATPQQLQVVAMLSPVLAQRLVKYRNLLGGFVHLQQLSEVYGLTHKAVARLRQHVFITKGFCPVQLAINHAPFGTLLRHPYLSKAQVKALFSLRRRGVLLRHPQDLGTLPEFKKGDVAKLTPYIKFE